MLPSWRRFACAAVLLAAVGVMLFAGKTLDAGVVVGSPHDFSSYSWVAGAGTCTACHLPHGADQEALWSRSLSEYRSLLDANGGGTYQVNYVHAPTIPCYDCHDTGSGKIDDNPPKSLGFGSHPPQDIAFGGSDVGYYENNPPSGLYGANRNTNPADNTTGGHFLSNNYNGTGSFRVGDKLPCRDCHDPHAWTSEWQAFIGIPASADSGVSRPPGLTSTQAVGSTYMRQNINNDTRDNAKSRYLCARCHGYSLNYGSPVRYNDINSAYNSSTRIPRPPDNVKNGGPPIVEHQYTTDTNAIACVSCHKHNSIVASCNACHSYPGLDNSSPAIKQMSPGHWPHVGRPGTGGTANSMGYACDVCHYNYSSRHNGSNDFTGSWWDNVDVQFNPALNPAFAGGGGPTYRTQPAYGGAFAKGIGVADGNTTPTPTCAGLYCHGDHPDRNRLTWEGGAKQPAWTGAVACGDCHKAGASFRQGNHAVHIDNTGAGPNLRGPGGIAVFSPTLNCADGTATGCHTAYGKTPTTTHARGTTTFRTSPAIGTATDNAGTQVCDACHSSAYAVAFFDNTLISNIKFGVQLAKESWWDNTYRLPCLTCHNNAGQTAGSTANARMDGTGAWAPGIEKYWRASGHGFPSGAPVDNTSTTTVSGNVNQVLPLPCGSCHDVNSRHFGNTTATGNAWRLLSSSGYSAGQGLDKFCALQCHGGAEAGTSWTCVKPALPMDHFWIDGNGLECPRDPNKEGTDTHPSSRSVEISGKTRSPNEMATNHMPIDSDIRSGGGNNFLCVTCHDPHGTGPGDAVHWGRSFAGANETSYLDNVHMLRYEERETLCTLCHI